jgi:glycosyltransferase involved in cell wall biosynthesis
MSGGKEMRILEVGKFYPPPFGGMETVLHGLVTELSKDAEVDVIVANTLAQTERSALGRGSLVKVASFGTLAGTSICPTMPLILRDLFRRKAYDIVHLHLPNPTGHFALQATLPKAVKMVVTWHSDIVRQKRLFKFYYPFLRSLLDSAAAIVAATPKNFDSSTQLSRERYSWKMHALPFGIDVTAFRESPDSLRIKREIKAKHAGNIIFACGRHIYYKGFEYLIEAVSRVEGVTLLLGGKGPLTPSLQALARRLGCADRVTFLGFIPEKELPGYYRAADVVCMPSVDPSEAFGMVQLEAMACEKPVVCCELGNGVTFVNKNGETGLVVAPRDANALAETLRELLGNAALRISMGKAGFRRVCSNFSLDSMREGHVRLFRTLLETEMATERTVANLGLGGD